MLSTSHVTQHFAKLEFIVACCCTLLIPSTGRTVSRKPFSNAEYAFQSEQPTSFYIENKLVFIDHSLVETNSCSNCAVKVKLILNIRHSLPMKK